MPIPWQTILLSVAIYAALPLMAGYFSRKRIIKSRRKEWFGTKFLHYITSISIIALLATLILLFSLKGEMIMENPLTIVWIAIPLFVQTMFIFSIGYFALARFFKLSYHDAAPAAMIGVSNHFEVAIATATMLFGLSSGAALATVVGVLIEVPLMLMLVSICKKTCYLFKECSLELPQCEKYSNTGIKRLETNTLSSMKKRFLFLCTGNSCRSQMAEGLLNSLYGDKYRVCSAETEPSRVNGNAIKV